MKPAFIITIDTEGDNLWSRPNPATTENVRFLPRFQSLCESYGLRPTWLVDFDITWDDRFSEFANDVLQRNVAEIGMHPHAWNTPPFDAITKDDFSYQPFLYQYPKHQMKEKLQHLHDDLQQRFGVPIRSHRAGRWAMNKSYASMLVDLGVEVDCSVTPGVNWSGTKGAPNGVPGPDFSNAPVKPYWMDIDCNDESPASRLLQVPMTISSSPSGFVSGINRAMSAVRLNLMRRAANRVFPIHQWLRPNGRNVKSMKRLVSDAVSIGNPCVEFMLHSSELMPGGSPRFATSNSIEKLFSHLEELFDYASACCDGVTLCEFSDLYAANNR